MIKLYNGDCLEVMDKLITEGVKVDMVLVDPPYGMGFQSSRRFEKHNKIKNDDNLNWLDKFSKLMFDLSDDNTAHYVFCSFHNIDIFKQTFEKYFKVKNVLIWEKNNHGTGDLKGDLEDSGCQLEIYESSLGHQLTQEEV